MTHGWEHGMRSHPADHAIQQGILTKSTKSRLEGLEAAKEELEVKIACEKMAKPKLTDEQVRHWILHFRMLDMTKKEHRQKLIDTFVNAIYLYDDKAILVFNYKEGSKTVDFSEVYSAVSGSDIECSGVPEKRLPPVGNVT